MVRVYRFHSVRTRDAYIVTMAVTTSIARGNRVNDSRVSGNGCNDDGNSGGSNSGISGSITSGKA
jgi:hypothetical protein